MNSLNRIVLFLSLLTASCAASAFDWDFLGPIISSTDSQGENVQEQNQFLSDYFGDALPEKQAFHWLSTRMHPRFHWKVGELILRILGTSLGHKVCLLLNSDPESLSLYLGLNSKHSEQAAKLCQTKWGIRRGAMVKDKRIWNIQRNYWSVQIPEGFNYPLDSWTRANNVTLIFGYKDEFSDDRLLRVLAHELAIGFDEKYILSKGFLSEQQLQVQSNLPGSTCEFLSAANFPVVRVATATIRALKIEAQVAEELGLKPTQDYSPLTDNSLSCLRRLKRMVGEISEIKQMLVKQEPYFTNFRLFCPFENVPILTDSKSNQAKVYAILDKAALQKNGSADFTSSCDYLQTPQLGTSNIEYSRGPKPRFTGGW